MLLSGAGLIGVYGGGTLEILDRDIIGSVAGDNEGPAVLEVQSGGVAMTTDSRLDGNIGSQNGAIAIVEDDASTLRSVRSTITNTSGPFAINDETETDFSAQRPARHRHGRHHVRYLVARHRARPELRRTQQRLGEERKHRDVRIDI